MGSNIPIPEVKEAARILAGGGGLRFGVATSDHQCEAYDERFEDVNDRWERSEGLVRRGRATDFWNRYPEDVELAAGLGCTLFRLSISWARVESRPGEFNDAGLRHYEAVVDEIRRAGMEPVVTLMHSTWPLHIEDTGSLWAPGWPERFAAYVGRVVEALGQKVGRWVTLNEPTMLPLGYVRPFWMRSYPRPPGLAATGLDRQLDAVARLVANLFRANAVAYDLVKAANPAALVTANPYLFGVPAWMQRLLDGRVRRAAGRGRFDHLVRGLADPPPWLRLLGAPSILCGNWWHLGIAGGLPTDLCPAGCAGKQDAVALDYYWGADTLDVAAWRRTLSAISGDYASAPTSPPLLRSLLEYHAGLFPGQPVWLAENGCVDRASGVSRAEYLRLHLAQVREAVAAGVPLDSYLYWSITTNREWGLPAGPSSDFGLYHVDLDGDETLRRVPTESAAIYRGLIASW